MLTLCVLANAKTLQCCCLFVDVKSTVTSIALWVLHSRLRLVKHAPFAQFEVALRSRLNLSWLFVLLGVGPSRVVIAMALVLEQVPVQAAQ